MKTNKLDSFERFVNDSLSGEEVAYNPSDWDDLSTRLNNVPTKPFYKNGWFIGGAAAVIISAGAFVYQTNKQKEAPIDIVEKTEQINFTEQIVNSENSVVENKSSIEVESNNNITKEKINTSSETISREEIIEEVTTNHQIPKEPAIVSSFTNQDEEESRPLNNNREETKVSIPVADYKASSNLIGCKGLTVSFKAVEQKDVNYLWSFGDGTYSSIIAPKHTYNTAGEYKVELIVQSTIDERILTKSSLLQTVIVHKDPELEILADEYLDKGCPMVSYSFIGDEVSSVYWNLGNGTLTKEKTVKSAYKKRGNYNVLLQAIGLNGCKSTVKKSLFIEKDYNLLAPSAFTPDGDGLNDEFIPEALKLLNNQFTMVIQSRVEGTVYETSGVDRPWDGKNQKTGLECPEANYIWVVNLINDKGEKEQYTGAVLIQR